MITYKKISVQVTMYVDFKPFMQGTKGEYSMKKFKLVLLISFLFIVGCSNFEQNMNSREVADFNFINQDHENVSLEELKGEWWIADFIFTNCVTVCLPMTDNMAILQQKLTEKNIDIQLVSFSVDPDRDTPEVLKEYAQAYDADFSNWSFLTGYDFDTIKDLSVQSFAAGLQREPDSDQVQHVTRFYLVNPEGEIIKYYEGLDEEEMDNIIKDLKVLIN